jgi:hypothetical protein
MMKRVRVAISLIGLYKEDNLHEVNYPMDQLALNYANKRPSIIFYFLNSKHLDTFRIYKCPEKEI